MGTTNIPRRPYLMLWTLYGSQHHTLATFVFASTAGWCPDRDGAEGEEAACGGRTQRDQGGGGGGRGHWRRLHAAAPRTEGARPRSWSCGGWGAGRVHRDVLYAMHVLCGVGAQVHVVWKVPAWLESDLSHCDHTHGSSPRLRTFKVAGTEHLNARHLLVAWYQFARHHRSTHETRPTLPHTSFSTCATNTRFTFPLIPRATGGRVPCDPDQRGAEAGC